MKESINSVINSPQISTKWTITSQLKSLNKRKDHDMVLEIPVLSWDRHKNVAVFNRLMASKPSPLDVFTKVNENKRLIS